MSEAIRLEYDAEWQEIEETPDELLPTSVDLWPPKTADLESENFFADLDKHALNRKLYGPPMLFGNEDEYGRAFGVALGIYVLLLLVPPILGLLNEYFEVIDTTLARRIAFGVTFGVSIPLSLAIHWWEKKSMNGLRRKVLKDYAGNDSTVLIDDLERLLESNPENAVIASLLVNVLVREGEYQRALDSLHSLEGSDEVRDDLKSKIEKVQAWDTGQIYSASLRSTS